MSKLRTARAVVASLAIGAALFAAAPSASAMAGEQPASVARAQATQPSGVKSIADASAQPGVATTFYRDTLWQLAVPAGGTVRASNEGGIEFVDGTGTVTARYAPAPVTEASGATHQITWTLEGSTLHQHVDIAGDSIQGALHPQRHPRPAGWWDCVVKKGQTTMAGGIVTGCIAGIETGCAPGAAVGGFAGALGGVTQGIFSC